MAKETTSETPGLDKIIKMLKAKPPKIKIGILGADAGKTHGNGATNYSVGAAHEFGTSKMPMRSFLRIPLKDNLNKYMAKNGMFDKDMVKEVVKTGELMPWLKKIALIAESIVQDGFNSGGFGKWKAWKGSYTSRTGMILVDTQQLRSSISSEIIT